MSTFGFPHHYYKNIDMHNICKLYQISISDLKPTNKWFNDKEKDLVEAFSRKSIRNVSFCKPYWMIDVSTII